MATTAAATKTADAAHVEEHQVTQREIQRAFMNLQPLDKTARNKAELTRDQILLVKTARKQKYTPKQLETLTGLSTERIADLVALKIKAAKK